MPEPSAPISPPSITVLNVDDNEANLYAVTRMLKRAGFTVVEAVSGEEALLKVAAGLPDLVILDVNLPDLDGFEVCRRIKADPATSSIPVLHLSASYILSEDKTRGLDEGADGYLVRPVEPPELVANVRALLRIKSAEKRAKTASARWQATFDAIEDGIYLLDPEGRVTRCNRAAGAIFGAEPASIVGRAFRDLAALPEPPGVLALGPRKFRVRTAPIPDEGSVCILTEVGPLPTS